MWGKKKKKKKVTTSIQPLILSVVLDYKRSAWLGQTSLLVMEPTEFPS